MAIAKNFLKVVLANKSPIVFYENITNCTRIATCATRINFGKFNRFDFINTRKMNTNKIRSETISKFNNCATVDKVLGNPTLKKLNWPPLELFEPFHTFLNIYHSALKLFLRTYFVYLYTITLYTKY